LPTPAALLAGLGPAWLSEATCLAWLLQALHPVGPRCPWCGQAFTSAAQLASWQALRRLRCHGCGRMCTALTNTPLHKSGLTPRAYVLLCLLSLAGLEPPAIAARLGMHPETVRRWRKRWQEAA
jgi:transposase-like protein